VWLHDIRNLFLLERFSKVKYYEYEGKIFEDYKKLIEFIKLDNRMKNKVIQIKIYFNKWSIQKKSFFPINWRMEDILILHSHIENNIPKWLKENNIREKLTQDFFDNNPQVLHQLRVSQRDIIKLSDIPIIEKVICVNWKKCIKIKLSIFYIFDPKDSEWKLDYSYYPVE